MSRPDLPYWLAWSQIRKIGPAKFGRLLRHFADLELAWQAPISELINAGLEENLAQEVAILRSQISPAQELEKLTREGVSVVTIFDEAYPRLLQEIYSPPPLLYYRGSLDALKKFTLAVVGTRKFSPYGRQATENLTGDLARQGVTIVSGLALGIDAIAHEATLAQSGLTVAVLGSSVDWQNIYPSANRHLARRIIDSGGAVLSEFPLPTTPTAFTFPRRNRLISGLSRGTLVVEAPASSGALITANFALEQNREVFAVPGNIYSPPSAGANELIRKGAKLVTQANDILEEYNFVPLQEFTRENKFELLGTEKIIVDMLSREPLHIDKLAICSKLKISALSGALTLLEMKGIIKDVGGKNYIIN